MQISIDQQTESAFKQAAKRAIISTEHVVPRFLYETGIKINSQPHHEILRQIFDNIDIQFDQFMQAADGLPIFQNLLDHEQYYDIQSNINAKGKNLKVAVRGLATGLYLECYRQGIFLNNRTPFILETIDGVNLLLHNTFHYGVDTIV